MILEIGDTGHFLDILLFKRRLVAFRRSVHSSFPWHHGGTNYDSHFLSSWPLASSPDITRCRVMLAA